MNSCIPRFSHGVSVGDEVGTGVIVGANDGAIVGRLVGASVGWTNGQILLVLSLLNSYLVHPSFGTSPSGISSEYLLSGVNANDSTWPGDG